MLISDKLKSFDFTYAEKEIVKYFLNQKEEIARQSTREISKRLYCSPSSIIRLCQKLGFTGFEEFKEMYVEELHYLNSNFSDINPSIPFMTEDNIQTISNKMCSLYHEIIDDTHSLLDHDMLRKSLNLLKNNKNIYIISSSSQNDLASTFRDKMARIGKHVNIYQHIEENREERIYETKKYILATSEKMDNGWKLYYYIDKSEISEQIREIMATTVLVMGLCLAVALIMMSGISKILSTRILQLKNPLYKR